MDVTARQNRVGRSNLKSERGAAMVEYAVLMGGVAITLMIAFQSLGGVVETELAQLSAEPVEEEVVDEPSDEGNSSVASATAAAPAAAAEETAPCPTGWKLIPNIQTKKNGQNVDANGDNLICQKDIPGNGKGNTNQNANVKDNNK